MPPKKKKRAKGRGRSQGSARAAAASNVERVDPNEKRRERLEQKRQERERAAAMARRRQARDRMVRWLLIGAVTAGLVWFFFLRTALPSEINGNPIEDYQTFAQESRNQQLHVEGDVTYASNPPVSGEHHAVPAACGVYSQPIPEEDWVHTLEHGAIGILYQPTLDPDEIKQIETIVQSYDSHIFSMPYPQLEDDPVVVTAWAHLMRLDDVDEDSIREFVDAFQEGGDAPEKADCPLTQDDPFDPNATPTGSPSAEPEPSPVPSKT